VQSRRREKYMRREKGAAKGSSSPTAIAVATSAAMRDGS